VAERQQRGGRDRQPDAEAYGDDQDGLPARHRPDLARGGTGEPQERELAAAPERDHDQRVDDGDRREGEEHHDEERAEPVVQLAVGVGRGDERGAVAHLESGVSLSQRLQARGRRRWLAGLDEDRAEQRGGQVTGGEFGGEQGVPEGQIAGVDRHDGGVGACAVAQHDRHAVADAGVRGLGAVASERDRVAVQGAQGPRHHAGVEAAALPSGEDLGGEGVIGAKARAERGGRQRDRRTYSGHRARIGQRGGREARPSAGDGELAGQPRLPLLGGGVVDGGGAEEKGAAQGDGEYQRSAG
jgi:hypothetical protein